jgi:hypothetical protein
MCLSKKRRALGPRSSTEALRDCESETDFQLFEKKVGRYMERLQERSGDYNLLGRVDQLDVCGLKLLRSGF